MAKIVWKLDHVVLLVAAALLAGTAVRPEVTLSTLGLDRDEILPPSGAGLRPLLDSNNRELETVYVTEESFADVGTFFAFRALWTSNLPLGVQIWRPVQGSETTLAFIGAVEIVPEQADMFQTVYIVSSLNQMCIATQKGDRIGFQVKDGNSSSFPIVYDESLETARHNILVAEANVGNMTHLSTLEFSKRMFPYKMNFIAYLLVGEAQSAEPKVECPKSLLVETVVVTTPPMIPGDAGPTGNPGPMGDTGMHGPIGWTGSTGPRGLPGQSGAEGIKGPLGGTGFTGDTGPTGVQGTIGLVGPHGDTGDVGDRGDTGPPGPDGMDGFVIYVNSSGDNSSSLPTADQPSLLSDPALSLALPFDDHWRSERFLIGLLVWFSLLSLLSLVLIGVLTCLCFKLRLKAVSRATTPAGGYFSQEGWNTFGTSVVDSELEFAKGSRGSSPPTSDSGGPIVVPVGDGMETLRAYESDENVRALREDTFKEFNNETIPGS